jgi:hypothetical protein
MSIVKLMVVPVHINMDRRPEVRMLADQDKYQILIPVLRLPFSMPGDSGLYRCQGQDCRATHGQRRFQGLLRTRTKALMGSQRVKRAGKVEAGAKVGWSLCSTVRGPIYYSRPNI